MRKLTSTKWEHHLTIATIFYAFCVFRSIDTAVTYFQENIGHPEFFLSWSKNELSTLIVLFAYLIWLSFHFYRSQFRYFPESNPAVQSVEYRAEIRETIREARVHRMVGYGHLAVTLGFFYLLAWNIAPPNPQQAKVVACLILWDLILVLPYRRSAAEFSGVCIGHFTGTVSENSSTSLMTVPAASHGSVKKAGPFVGDFYLDRIGSSSEHPRPRLASWYRGSRTSDGHRLQDIQGRMYGGRLGSTEAEVYVGRFTGVVQTGQGYRCWLVSPWRQQHEANEWWWFKNAAELLAVFIFLAIAPPTTGTPALIWAAFALFSVVLGIVLHGWAKEQFTAASKSSTKSKEDPVYRNLRPDAMTSAFLQR